MSRVAINASIFKRNHVVYNMFSRHVSNTKPVIAVDVDDVLCQFIPALCKYHRRVKESNLQPSDFHCYIFRHVYGGTEPESHEFLSHFYNSKEFEQAEPIPHALETLTYLKNEKNFDLKIVTSRRHDLETKTKEWIDKHYPNIFSQLLFGNHFNPVGKQQSKAQLCESINAIMLIDDNKDYCLECSENMDNVILFDWNSSYQWNKIQDDNVVIPENVRRAACWKDIKSIFDTMTRSYC